MCITLCGGHKVHHHHYYHASGHFFIPLSSHYLYHHYHVPYHQSSSSLWYIINKTTPTGHSVICISSCICSLSHQALVWWTGVLAGLFSAKDWFALAKSNRLNRLLLAWGGRALRGAFRQCNMLINRTLCTRTTTSTTTTKTNLIHMQAASIIHL